MAGHTAGEKGREKSKKGLGTGMGTGRAVTSPRGGHRGPQPAQGGAGSAAPRAVSCILGIILLFFSSSSTPGRALKPLHLWPGG